MFKKFLQTSILSVFAGLLFISTITFAAWSAHWWGTDWIQSGEVITAQKIAENFEYLFNTKADKPPQCNGKNKVLQWNNDWICASIVATAPQMTYSWKSSAWSVCTKIDETWIKTRTVSCINESGVNVTDNNCTATKPQLSKSCITETLKSTFIGTNVCSKGYSAPVASQASKAKIVLREPFRNGTGDKAYCVFGKCSGLNTHTAVASYLNISPSTLAWSQCQAQNNNNTGKINSYDTDDLRNHCKGDFIYYVKCDYVFR